MQKKLLLDVTSRFDEIFFRSKVLFRPIGWFSELNWPFPSIGSFFPHFPLTPQSVHNSKASAGAGHSGQNLFKTGLVKVVQTRVSVRVSVQHTGTNFITLISLIAKEVGMQNL